MPYIRLQNLVQLLIQTLRSLRLSIGDGVRITRATLRHPDTDETAIVFDRIYPLRPMESVRVLAFKVRGVEYWQSAVYLKSRRAFFSIHQLFWIAELFIDLSNSRILVLGGAGCSLPEDIGSHLKRSQIDVVEIRPRLLELARRYFLTSDNIQLHLCDAYTFISSSLLNYYDTVYVDLCTEPSSVPALLLDLGFWRQLRNVLRDHNAILFVNLNSIAPLVKYQLIYQITSEYAFCAIICPHDSTNDLLVFTDLVDEQSGLQRFHDSHFSRIATIFPLSQE